MADETEAGAQIGVVETAAPTEAPTPKKQRAARRSKAEIDAAAAAKPPKIRQKRTVQADVMPTSTAASALAATKQAVAQGPAKTKPISQPAEQAAPVTAGDEMVDLLQVEEENKKLRQALAEKLRAENADLRKRLGI